MIGLTDLRGAKAEARRAQGACELFVSNGKGRGNAVGSEIVNIIHGIHLLVRFWFFLASFKAELHVP